MCENFVSVVFSFKEKKEDSKKFDPAQPSKLVGFLSSFAYSSSKWKGKEKKCRSQKLLALTFPMYPHKVEKNTHIHI
ncbi:hypothetical protein HBH98_214270 [Parastagonospora nodorum]|nr:hypothetical protein HBH98_214270 [Parastagonospora nodorum]KAH4360994.1 hypothetical protein HBH97_201520 [Parastagonospora nodorum]KAH4376906.1 hypothetical protein HBH99_209620 [Parastagonospora nodorum]KAH4956505.1 hypothetical protein HBI78_201380 [Parastagonospora nodorum]KAH4977717.1 hypothetical protein HBI76_220350 [Parastagonospora nodorum]